MAAAEEAPRASAARLGGLPAGGLSSPRALLLVPVLITLHNAEEAAGAAAGLRMLAHRFAAVRPPLPAPRTVYLALALATLAPWAIWMGSRLAPARRHWIALLLLLQALMLANAFWHVAAAQLVGGYAPGLATAVLVNLPFSVYLLRRAAREAWVPPRTLRFLVLSACALHALPALAMVWPLTHHSVP